MPSSYQYGAQPGDGKRRPWRGVAHRPKGDPGKPNPVTKGSFQNATAATTWAIKEEARLKEAWENPKPDPAPSRRPVAQPCRPCPHEFALGLRHARRRCPRPRREK